MPTTFLLTSFYWDNLIYFGLGPKRGPDGVLAITLPDGRQAAAGHRRRGHRQGAPTASSRRGREYIGKTVGIAGEAPDRRRDGGGAGPRRSARRCSYNAVTPDAYRGFGFPGADDLGNMFQFKRDFKDYFFGARDLATARALNPSLQTFDEWVSRHKGQIPIE